MSAVDAMSAEQCLDYLHLMPSVGGGEATTRVSVDQRTVTSVSKQSGQTSHNIRIQYAVYSHMAHHQ